MKAIRVKLSFVVLVVVLSSCTLRMGGEVRKVIIRSINPDSEKVSVYVLAHRRSDTHSEIDKRSLKKMKCMGQAGKDNDYKCVVTLSEGRSYWVVPRWPLENPPPVAGAKSPGDSIK